jgi:AraC-like DNA-binding protein
VIVFPQGDAHVMSSAPGMRGTFHREPMDQAVNTRLPVSVCIDGGGADRSELICGFLGCDARPFNPLLSTLPRVLHVPKAAAGDGLLEHFIKLALAESNALRSGGACVLARLSELLFVEIVRRYIATLPAESTSWLAGLRDPNIGRVLGKIHDKPAHAWSLEELAREGGLSRSVLAERFAHFVGVPPMQYLMQWRMQLAASLLTNTGLSLAEIAERVGYGSETALSRAYKRTVGMAPADWRRERRAVPVA